MSSLEGQISYSSTWASLPFVPSRFEGLIGVYHQSLATGAGLPVTLADARCSLELATALNPLPGWVANRFLPRGEPNGKPHLASTSY